MKQLRIVLLLALAASGGAWAQASGQGHDSHHPAAAATSPEPAASLVSGVVRKVDRDAQKVTLRHGPIPTLEMPEMTMVFRVADPKMLENLKPKESVLFKAERVDGQLTVTYIGPSQ